MNDWEARVLVVDDQWTVRQQLSRALEAVGVRCDCAVDGDDALVKYLYHRHEVIVTDLRMPKENGHSLAMAVLGLPDPPKVVALTGVLEPRLANDLVARGVTEVAFKPIDYFAFADRVKGLLAPSPSSAQRAPDAYRAVAPSQTVDSSRQCESAASPSRWEVEQQFIESPPPHRWLTMCLAGLDWGLLPSPQLEVRKALQQLPRRKTSDRHECRREGRLAINEKAVVLSLTLALEPDGQPTSAIVRDVSQHGIGLIVGKPIENQPIAVSWEGLNRTRIVVLARVLRCRELGPYYDVGASIARFKSQKLADASV